MAPLEDPSWVTLKKHENDTSLNDEFDVFTWPIPKVTEGYRIFRVIQNGKNKMAQNKDWSDTFIVSGFEIYGETSSKYKIEHCIYKEDMDLNGKFFSFFL